MINLDLKYEGNSKAFDPDWLLKDPYTVCFTIGGIEFKSPKMTRKEAEAMKEALWGLTQHECQHPKVMPKFDLEEAEKPENHTKVRELWPRFCGKCPDCDYNGILYASFAHYIAGDW
jgi:hypothetical protein